MPNQLLSGTEISNLIDNELSANGVDVTVPGTFTHSLVTPLKRAINSVNSNVISSYNRGILELASGKDLEEKCLEFGVKRNQSSVSLDTDSTNFYVYLSTGKTEDYALDIASPIIIPKNNLKAIDNVGNNYFINTDIVLMPGQSTSFADIYPVNSVDQTVGVNAINSLEYVIDDSIVNLDPAKFDSFVLGCSNSKAITVAVTTLSDDDIRRKAFFRINAMNNNNETAIRLALEEYGITDITYKYDYFGFGTIGILLRIGSSTAISRGSIDKLNNLVGNIVPFARIIVPEELVVRLQVDVKFKDGGKIADAKNNIANSISNYFNNLNMGDFLDPAALTNIILSEDNVLKAACRCIFIDDRKVLLRKQYTLTDQLYVLDPVSPIEFTA